MHLSAYYQRPVSVEFTDVCVTIGTKEILRSVYGGALSGEILAIMGPSGKYRSEQIESLSFE